MTYWIIMPSGAKTAALIDEKPTNGPSGYMYFKKKPLMKRFPKQAKLFYSDNHPEGVELFDIVDNVCSLMIVSGKVKQIIESVQSQGIEFLKVGIYDHAEALVSDDYYIVNPLLPVDIIDTDKTKVRISALDGSQIRRIKSPLRLKQGAVDSHTHYFTPVNWVYKTFISDTLLQAFKQHQVTGIKAYRAEGWDEFDWAEGDYQA